MGVFTYFNLHIGTKSRKPIKWWFSNYSHVINNWAVNIPGVLISLNLLNTASNAGFDKLLFIWKLRKESEESKKQLLRGVKKTSRSEIFR